MYSKLYHKHNNAYTYFLSLLQTISSLLPSSYALIFLSSTPRFLNIYFLLYNIFTLWQSVFLFSEEERVSSLIFCDDSIESITCAASFWFMGFVYISFFRLCSYSSCWIELLQVVDRRKDATWKITWPASQAWIENTSVLSEQNLMLKYVTKLKDMELKAQAQVQARVRDRHSLRHVPRLLLW